MGFMQPEMPAATPMPKLPQAPEAGPAPRDPGTKPPRKSMQTSFLGASSTPQAPTNMGGKTLLGQ